MAILDRNKLEKLTIYVYADRMRANTKGSPFTVMYNPESFSMSHRSKFYGLRGIQVRGRHARFANTQGQTLKLDLILDGTGVSSFGPDGLGVLTGLNARSVSRQVQEFLNLCMYMDGDLHEPKFLKIQWGRGELKAFDCRLQSVDIAYTSFERNGEPLRAKLSTVFAEDLEPKKQLLLENKKSPDLTRSREVKSGDTLPSLCKEIYGDAGLYLWVARENQLDDFRNLTPGQRLRFPSLTAEPTAGV
jgi:hypothetical protein